MPGRWFGMKVIVTIFLLILLSGCATYTTESQPLYYEDGQLVPDVNPDSLYYGSSASRFAYAGAYPWWSMDYFYLGHHPYRPWTYTYYSPYFYPYYFSVLYPPWYWRSSYWYGDSYAWYDPYWYHYYRRYHRSQAGGYQGNHEGNSVSMPVVGTSGGNPVAVKPKLNRSEFKGISSHSYKSPPGSSRKPYTVKKTSPGYTAPARKTSPTYPAPVRPKTSASTPTFKTGKTSAPVSRAPSEYTRPDQKRK